MTAEPETSPPAAAAGSPSGDADVDSVATGERAALPCHDSSVLATWWRTWRQDLTCNPLTDARTTLAIWRAGQLLYRRPGVVPFLLRRVFRMADRLWTRGYIGAELPFQVTAGPGMRLPHAGRGIILHPTVRIGSGVTMYHQVTVGVRDDRPAAVIGDGAYIGAGAKILGPLDIGAGARIGANAVVVRDVPAGATAVGVPATVRAGDARPQAR
ncbi:serine O-acetyltransferase [Geodermatophilus sp. SYSU D00742]